MTDPKQELVDWWRTDISQIQPGKIAFRGEPVETAIREKSFAQMIWCVFWSIRPLIPTTFGHPYWGIRPPSGWSSEALGFG